MPCPEVDIAGQDRQGKSKSDNEENDPQLRANFPTPLIELWAIKCLYLIFYSVDKLCVHDQ